MQLNPQATDQQHVYQSIKAATQQQKAETAQQRVNQLIEAAAQQQKAEVAQVPEPEPQSAPVPQPSLIQMVQHNGDLLRHYGAVLEAMGQAIAEIHGALYVQPQQQEPSQTQYRQRSYYPENDF